MPTNASAGPELPPALSLLATADALLGDDVAGPLTPVGRVRGAAYAIRVALEAAVDAALTARDPDLREVSMRAKQLCLRHYAGPDLANRVSALWSRLCMACKYHHDELGPRQAQIRALVTAVAATSAELTELSAPGEMVDFPQHAGAEQSTEGNASAAAMGLHPRRG